MIDRCAISIRSSQRDGELITFAGNVSSNRMAGTNAQTRRTQ